MSQVIAWILFIFVLIFIYKVGSLIWRTLGVLFLLFLLWIYRDVIFTQVSQWTRDFRWDQLPTYLDQGIQWVKDGWQALQSWISNRIS
ncbi:hypothetical protein [Enterococcus gallinarum]|uniref:hypothetical protein n=1 Tax=Enterococcus gallinarum TaxID=1353 RepID=UPI0012E2B565|nr:hypothetical protein [Enterococcus gallinarum]MUO32571.1 hypothetical protein [Enterococcus gallinarum]